MPIGSERIGEGLLLGYDNGTTGAEVVHKATSGFVYAVNVTVSGSAYTAAATLSIRDGTGNVVWQLDIPANAAVDSMAFSVNLAALFVTDIRTLITANAGAMTVAYQ